MKPTLKLILGAAAPLPGAWVVVLGESESEVVVSFREASPVGFAAVAVFVLVEVERSPADSEDLESAPSLDAPPAVSSPLLFVSASDPVEDDPSSMGPDGAALVGTAAPAADAPFAPTASEGCPRAE